jgi:hypothetical protein
MGPDGISIGLWYGRSVKEEFGAEGAGFFRGKEGAVKTGGGIHSRGYTVDAVLFYIKYRFGDGQRASPHFFDLGAELRFPAKAPD